MASLINILHDYHNCHSFEVWGLGVFAIKYDCAQLAIAKLQIYKMIFESGNIALNLIKICHSYQSYDH